LTGISGLNTRDKSCRKNTVSICVETGVVLILVLYTIFRGGPTIKLSHQSSV